jgi:hypothetical protein
MSLAAQIPAASDVLGASLGAPRMQRARRLHREGIWSPVVPGLVQFTILLAIIALWEIGARTGYVDGFFWSTVKASSLRRFAPNLQARPNLARIDLLGRTWLPNPGHVPEGRFFLRR